jgi:hypothetical protein
MTHQVVVVLEVDEVLLGEQGAEGRESQGVSLVSTELHHVDEIGRGEVEGAGDLGVEASEGSVESVDRECSGSGASNGATAGNVGVGADGVRRAGVVDIGVLTSRLSG